ncbi:hypothetical protein J3S89_13500 [Pinisolibacter sp. B13]|uniref:hypothetical protein n=1 Tax=Pinisolibacter aquiterrae TaxID=2815579 RepID=UPI001C3E4ABB|nr:hypothetical protein [Pinisolibacter aquiterrae]MBV5265064.1 hypothetical protein [Pinisolibacter aquiterrae]
MFGATGPVLNAVGGFFRGEPLIFVRATRRGSFTYETLRLIAAAGPGIRPIFATRDAYEQVALRSPKLASLGRVAILSPLSLVTVPKGIEALWLLPTVAERTVDPLDVDAAALADLFGISPDVIQTPHPPEVVFVGSSHIGVQASHDEMIARSRLKALGREGSEQVEHRTMTSPFALDAMTRARREGALTYDDLTHRRNAGPTVVACDEAVASALTLAGFQVLLASPATADDALAEPERITRERAVEILIRSLADTRFVVSASRRRLSWTAVQARLDLREMRPTARSPIETGLRDLDLIDDVEVGVLARDMAQSSGLGESAAHILRRVVRQEASESMPRLLRRADLVDDVLDLAAACLPPTDQPAALRLRARIDGDVEAAIYDLNRLIQVHGASQALLDQIGTVFADLSEVVVGLAGRFTSAGEYRVALALVAPAAERPGASPEVLRPTVDTLLKLGLSDRAMVFAEKLATFDPTDGAVIDALMESDDTPPPSSTQSDERPLQLLLVDARRALARGESDTAEHLLRRLMAESNPALAIAASEDLTDILLVQERDEEAVEIATRAVDKAAGRLRDAAAVALSEVQLFAGFNDAALKTLRLAQSSGSTQAGTRLRALLVRSGRLEEEIAEFEKIHAQAPTLNHLGHLMQLLSLADRMDDMRAVADEARRQGRNHPADIAFLEGTILVGKMMWHEASERLAPFFDSSSRGQRIAMLVGRAALGAGDAARAQIAFHMAAQAPGTRTLAQTELARLAETAGDWAEAARLYSGILAQRPLSVVNGMRWATAVRRSGTLPDLKISLEAQAEASLEARVAFWLSLLAGEEGRLDGVIHWARRAFALEPLNTDLARYLNDALILDGDVPGAVKVVDDIAAGIRPIGLRVIEVADMYRSIGEMDKARDFARRAVQSAPRNPGVLQIAARIHSEVEDFEEARRLVHLGLKIDPARMGGYILGARIARRLEDMEEADRLDAAAARIWPDRSAALSSRVERAISRRDTTSADHYVHRVMQGARIHGEKLPMRLLWSVAALYAEKGDFPRFLELAREVLGAIDAVFPSDLPMWHGEPSSGETMMVIARGGPGDEVRLYGSILRRVGEDLGHLVHVGDPRLESIFRRNFPSADFIGNPWSGRRLHRRRDQIPDALRRGFAPGSLEAARRFSVFVPRKELARVRWIATADSLITTLLHPHFGDAAPAGDPRPLIADPERLAEVRALLAGLPKGPKIGISWRASYVSANRFSGAFFDVEEMADLLAVEGAVYIDLHPNVIDEEFERAQELAGGRFVRPPFDLYNDFEAIAALAVELDAVIVPGVTQRDVAGAFRTADIWSFNLAKEYSERWRITRDERDRFQPAILHHDTTRYGDRAAIAAALKARVEQLVRGR